MKESACSLTGNQVDSPVQSKLNDTDRLLSELYDNLETLSVILHPVLNRDDTPKTVSKETMEISVRRGNSEYYDQIASQNSYISSMINKVQELKLNLEI